MAVACMSPLKPSDPPPDPEYIAATIPCPECKGAGGECGGCYNDGRNWPACIDCGEPNSGSCPAGRCRDCDQEYVVASSSCRECARWMWREEFGGPIAQQHAAGCSLANDPDYAPRTPEELAALRTRKFG